MKNEERRMKNEKRRFVAGHLDFGRSGSWRGVAQWSSGRQKPLRDAQQPEELLDC
jgi:hypothetical protein